MMLTFDESEIIYGLGIYSSVQPYQLLEDFKPRQLPTWLMSSIEAIACQPKKIFKFPEHFSLLGGTLREAVQNSVGWSGNIFMTHLRKICFLFATEWSKCQAQGPFYGNSDILGFHII